METRAMPELKVKAVKKTKTLKKTTKISRFLKAETEYRILTDV
jgi:hypothetical protein